jgi:hypothetical protein
LNAQDMSSGVLATEHPAARSLAERHRLRWWEALPWIAALAYYFLFPRYLGFGTDLLITILFALSLDLALGYAGIVTLGHAAFFGAGAYTVGMLAKFASGTNLCPHLCSPRVSRPQSGWPQAGCCCGPRLDSAMLTLCTMGVLEESCQHGRGLHRRLRWPRQRNRYPAFRTCRVQSAVSEHAVSLCALACCSSAYFLR